MTKKQALKIYATVFPEGNIPNNFSNQERDVIAQEMLSVISAKTEPEAMKIIEWWDCWETGMTCLQAVRRIRKLAKAQRLT